MTPLTRLVEQGKVLENVPLGPLTTYKSGGPARYLAEIDDIESLRALIATGVTASHPLLVLGRGSNLVVADAGFAGLVIRLRRSFAETRIEGTAVTAGSAVPLPRLARTCVDQGLRGLEFFVGIPGSVGGAVRQNAGCFGSETKDRLVEARIINLRNGAARTDGPDALELSYRHSNVESDDLIIDVTFETERGNAEEGRRKIREIIRWRRDNQPGGTLNAGSVFKNPPDISAGELIDSLGLKGQRVGDVTVSDKHANFFVAGPEATSEDVRGLVDKIKERVLRLSGTILEPEIQFVGFRK
ncbi:MAG: UDP-N-acetylmuramate dehydrogenase [Acidobacteria bacterium]|nr:UDP-N-acetylmuramate dehydrogenase [Acidobacteriota bacterium]